MAYSWIARSCHPSVPASRRFKSRNSSSLHKGGLCDDQNGSGVGREHYSVTACERADRTVKLYPTVLYRRLKYKNLDHPRADYAEFFAPRLRVGLTTVIDDEQPEHYRRLHKLGV